MRCGLGWRLGLAMCRVACMRRTGGGETHSGSGPEAERPGNRACRADNACIWLRLSGCARRHQVWRARGSTLHSTCATQRAHVAPLAEWVWEADAGCRDSLDVCDVVPAVSALKSSLLCSQAHANTAMTRLACGQSHSPVLRQAGVNSRNATNGERGTRRPPCSRETRMISALRPCSPVRVHLLEVTVYFTNWGLCAPCL